MNARLVRCRYTDRFKNPCSNEAVDESAPLVLCARHTTGAIDVVRDLLSRGVIAQDDLKPRTLLELVESIERKLDEAMTAAAPLPPLVSGEGSR